MPDAPTAAAAAVGDAQLTVTFTPPANDGGSPILSYTATCTDSTNPGDTPVSNSGAASPIIVTPLLNGDTYTCAVTATNGDGTGAASSPSAATVPAPTPPDAPTQPAVAAGNGQFSVGFTAPADNGSAITGYNATCTDITNLGNPQGSMSGTASPLLVTGLVDGDSYTCDVTATSNDGTSAASPQSASIVFANAPATPATPTVTQGAGSLSVAFTQPSGNGDTISNDTATCSDGVDTAAVLSQLGSPIVMTALNGLIPAKSYTCQVTATNTVGTSAPSPASTPSVVFATVPATPAQPSVSQGDLELVVSYVEPVDNGSAITSYSAVCTSMN
ncbi:MAG: fibronectin type III domain-containing protein, partial [Acidimicrobiia bacterium]